MMNATRVTASASGSSLTKERKMKNEKPMIKKSGTTVKTIPVIKR